MLVQIQITLTGLISKIPAWWAQAVSHCTGNMLEIRGRVVLRFDGSFRIPLLSLRYSVRIPNTVDKNTPYLNGDFLVINHWETQPLARTVFL